MKKTKLIVCLIFAVALLCGGLCACKQAATEDPASALTITLAYQNGIGYAPFHVIETQKLIEKNYGEPIDVQFIKLNSGTEINEGIVGGTIDVGAIALGPVVSAIASGIDYKIISNLCSQSHGLMTNQADIQSLADIGTEDIIGLVTKGSFHHILLAMAAKETLGDAHAFDDQIQILPHADGMAALESGTIQLHLTSSPYIMQERANANFHELPEIRTLWPQGNSYLVAVATSALAENEKLFRAVSDAFTQAIDFLNSDLEGAIEIETEYLQLDADQVREYLTDDSCLFFPEIKGVYEIADFMYQEGFIENQIMSIDEMKYENVQGD